MIHLLETRSLTIGYKQSDGRTVIVQKNINASVTRGEIISLMGQNGVGKTTFLKTISGLLPKINGDISYNGDALESLRSKKLATRLSLVLTEKPSSMHLKVVELIALGRQPYSHWLGTLSTQDRNIIEWAIDETHINYLANKRLYELSDGQLQKVMIARALAQQTDLIILDEPTAHLDLYNKIEVMLLLRRIAEKGKGILISTHDMQISTQLSDKLWLFNFEKPVTIGTPEDLILNGELEESLYLANHGYDLMHGTVNSPFEAIQEVSLEGAEIPCYWTGRALQRNKIKVTESAEIKISISENNWILLQGNNEIVCKTIDSLIKSLKNLHHPQH